MSKHLIQLTSGNATDNANLYTSPVHKSTTNVTIDNKTKHISNILKDVFVKFIVCAPSSNFEEQ